MARRRGFSLIELMVVISIIAILLGIILAAMPKVREAGLKTACGANLHGVGAGIESYKMDHADKFPAARYMPPPMLSGDTDPPLNIAINDHIDYNNPAYQCPGDRMVYDLEYTTEEGETKICGMSYTYITGLSGQTFEQSFFARFLNRTPTNTPVLHDYDGGTFELQDGQEIQVGFFHSERQVLFVDGHVGPIESN